MSPSSCSFSVPRLAATSPRSAAHARLASFSCAEAASTCSRDGFPPARATATAASVRAIAVSAGASAVSHSCSVAAGVEAVGRGCGGAAFGGAARGEVTD